MRKADEGNRSDSDEGRMEHDRLSLDLPTGGRLPGMQFGSHERLIAGPSQGLEGETMLEKLDGSEGSVLGYRLSGVIDKADYAAMVPEMESLVAQYGTVQLLCDLTDLRWEKASVWGSDLHFGKEFHDAITRMAIVGDGVGWRGNRTDSLDVHGDRRHCPGLHLLHGCLCYHDADQVRHHRPATPQPRPPT